MKQVVTTLEFQRAVHQTDWLLYLLSLEDQCPCHFAYNRSDYAQFIPEYLARMYNMKDSDPDTWEFFSNGHFAVQKSKVPFTGIGVDHAQEHMNKVLKGENALRGISTDSDAILKYCLTAPEMQRLSVEYEEMLGMSKKEGRKQHYLFCSSILQRHEKTILKIRKVIEQCNPFDLNEQDQDTNHLFNMVTKEIIPDKVKHDILTTRQRGEIACNSFVETLIAGEENLWNRLPQLKYQNWTSVAKLLPQASDGTGPKVKATTSNLSRLVIIARLR